MIFAGRAPTGMSPIYQTFLSTLSRSFLLRWRVLSILFQLTALFCLLQSREEIVSWSLGGPPYTETDFQSYKRSCETGLALTFVSLLVPTAGYLSGRTTREEALSTFHASCHTISGVMLISLWVLKAHFVRVWHIFYFFSAPPLALEGVALYQLHRSGLYQWW